MSSNTGFDFKSRKVILIIAVILGIAITAGVHYYFYSVSHVATDDAFIEGHAVPISAKISGHVLKVYVDDNQEVKDNALLLELDPRDYQAKVDMAQANYEAAKIKAAQAQEDVQRYNKLIVNDEISKQDIDHAVMTAAIAKAGESQAKAAFEQAKLELSYTKITVPSAGTITQRSIEAGAFIQPGQVVMMIVTPERWVIANLKETELTGVRSGQPVKVEIDAYPGKIFRAHVDSIQRGTGSKFSLLPPEDATGNYVKVVQRVPVKIVFDDQSDPQHPLALGMSVVPSIETK